VYRRRYSLKTKQYVSIFSLRFITAAVSYKFLNSHVDPKSWKPASTAVYFLCSPKSHYFRSPMWFPRLETRKDLLSLRSQLHLAYACRVAEERKNCRVKAQRCCVPMMILECARSHARDKQYETVLMSGIREIVIKNKNTRWFFIAVRFVLHYEIARIPLLQYFCVSLRDTKRLFIPLQRGVQRFITKAIHCSPSLCSSENGKMASGGVYRYAIN